MGLNLIESEKGLLLNNLNPKSEAAEKGMIAGDIILSVNQTPIKSVADLKRVIDETKKSTKKLFLFVKRGNSNYTAVLSI